MGALPVARLDRTPRLIVAGAGAIPGTLEERELLMATPTPKRLLVIDDDVKITALFADFFGDRYEVETAMNGVQGLTAMLERPPDLVLLDINMPGVSGLQVLRDIRTIDRRIPVIMVTGNGDIGTAEDALKHGAFAYLPKPFQLQYVAHLVAAAIGPKPVYP